jgi:hypothetical protein
MSTAPPSRSWPARSPRRLDPDQDDDDEGLGDELRDGMRRFEVSHPDLASVIGRAADALGGIGL